jgi:hypothetical protein
MIYQKPKNKQLYDLSNPKTNIYKKLQNEIYLLSIYKDRYIL